MGSICFNSINCLSYVNHKHKHKHDRHYCSQSCRRRRRRCLRCRQLSENIQQHISTDISHVYNSPNANESATIRSRQVSFFNGLPVFVAFQILNYCTLILLLLLLLLLLRFQWFEIVYLECKPQCRSQSHNWNWIQLCDRFIGFQPTLPKSKSIKSICAQAHTNRVRCMIFIWKMNIYLLLFSLLFFSMLLFNLTCIFHFSSYFYGNFPIFVMR